MTDIRYPRRVGRASAISLQPTPYSLLETSEPSTFNVQLERGWIQTKRGTEIYTKSKHHDTSGNESS